MECRICGNRDGNKAYVVREMMFGFRDEFNYLECTTCGCLQIKEIPAGMSKYYPQDYYSISAKPPEHRFIKETLVSKRDGFAIFGQGFIGRLLYSLFPAEDLRLLATCQLSKKSRVLDVGCGAGFLLYRLKNAGFENVAGVDPYISSDIKYKNGLIIYKKELEKIEEYWDLIMFNHSLEHIYGQQSVLNAVSARLTKGGVCLIRMPTVSSYVWQHYRENWVQLDAPRHFCLHSEQSISIAAEKAGLNIISSYRDSTEFQFWGSEQYVMDIPLESDKSYLRSPVGSMFSNEDIASFKKRGKQLNELNQGDQVVICLVHKDV